MKEIKYKYYVCHKKDNSVWFSCDTKQEAIEWIEIAIVKAQESGNKFYYRKERCNGKEK